MAFLFEAFLSIKLIFHSQHFCHKIFIKSYWDNKILENIANIGSYSKKIKMG